MTITAEDDSFRHQPMQTSEFVGFSSLSMAINSLATSIMLAALPQIAGFFQMSDPNRQHLVLTVFFVGFALGQIFVGPLADRFGRRATLLGGVALYVIATIGCLFANSFEALILARFVQGLASASPRIVTVSSVRDCYVGAPMARVMSLVMTVLFIAPIIAPTIGHFILIGSNWQALFVALLLHGLIVFIWGYVRFPETQRPEQRQPIRALSIYRGCRDFLLNRQSALISLAAGLSSGCLLGFLVASPQVIGEHYGLGHNFTFAFSAIAVTMGLAAYYNSRIVAKLGMIRIARGSLIICAVVAVAACALQLSGHLNFVLFMLTFFILNSLLLMNSANFTSIAMAPHGAIAGTASSIYGASTTLMSAVIASTIGQAYDGSPTPLMVGSALTCVGAYILLELSRLVMKPAS